MSAGRITPGLRAELQAHMPSRDMAAYRQLRMWAAATGGAALLLGTGWASGAAKAQLGAVEQLAADALPEPPEWRCDRIAPEYSAFLAAGNSPDEWRYAGRVSLTSGKQPETYLWSDWLRWFEATCDPATVVPANATAPSLPVIMGGVIAGVGVIGLIGSGSPSDSPG